MGTETIALETFKKDAKNDDNHDDDKQDHHNEKTDQADDVESAQKDTKKIAGRWLVLVAIASLSLMKGFYDWHIPIADTLRQLLTIDESKYNKIGQVNNVATAVSTVPCSMFLSLYGLRMSTFILMLICVVSNLSKALCLSDLWPHDWSNDARYPVMLGSEVFVGIAKAMSYCVQFEMAREWFSDSDHTQSMAELYAEVTFGCTTNLFVPYFIASVHDMHKLSPVFVIGSLALCLIVTLCVCMSHWEPSNVANLAPHVPIKKSLFVMVHDWHYIILFVTIGLNVSSLKVEQKVLNSILLSRRYDNFFVGTILNIIKFSGLIFKFRIARWIDKSSHHLALSRYFAMFFSMALAGFNVTLDMENSYFYIIGSAIVASLAISLFSLAASKTLDCSTVSFMPVQVVGAMSMVNEELFQFLLNYIFEPIKELKLGAFTGYRLPLGTFCVIITLVSVIYAVFFKPPDPVVLRAKVLAT